MSNILEKLRQVEAENERIRAALAVSKDPCVYCSLPAEEWAKCAQGFPGCARSDDAMGCPELGAAMALREAEGRVKALEEALKTIAAWASAYPLAIFPEPDFAKAHALLSAGGMTLDAISASNMRHVVEGVGGIARAALASKEEGGR